jgi:hypothetical protein
MARMAGPEDFDDDDPDVQLRRLIEADALVLARAAARLRWSGWFWFFALAVAFIFTMVLGALGRMPALFIGSIMVVILLGITLFYFALANYVARGHRWAIGVALFLVSVVVTLLLWKIFTPQPIHLVMAVIETMYLIGTLGLFKSLLQSWGAARRLEQLVQRQAVEEYGMVEESR